MIHILRKFKSWYYLLMLGSSLKEKMFIEVSNFEMSNKISPIPKNDFTEAINIFGKFPKMIFKTFWMKF